MRVVTHFSDCLLGTYPLFPLLRIYEICGCAFLWNADWSAFPFYDFKILRFCGHGHFDFRAAHQVRDNDVHSPVRCAIRTGFFYIGSFGTFCRKSGNADLQEILTPLASVIIIILDETTQRSPYPFIITYIFDSQIYLKMSAQQTI